MDKLSVCLLNDSFPPLIDGVANTVVNYAHILTARGETASVVTPNGPGAKDEQFPFPVLRYPSLPTAELVGYRAGYPFSPSTLGQLRELNTNLIHSHCPFVSSVMARSLRNVIDAPLVFTYHTKFDIDVANAVKGKLLQEATIKILVDNIARATRSGLSAAVQAKICARSDTKANTSLCPTELTVLKEGSTKKKRRCFAHVMPTRIPPYFYTSAV